jgi:hypothetical protein
MAALVSACGGGGGGDSGVQVTMSRSAVEYTSINGGATSQDITFTMSPPASGTLYGVAVTDGVEFDAQATALSATSATYTLSLHIPQTTALTAGDHNGNLTFKLCRDAACSASPLWSGKLPYLVHAFTMPTDPIHLVGPVGPPISVDIPVTPPDTQHRLTFSVDTGSPGQYTVDQSDPAHVRVTVLTDTGLVGSTGVLMGPGVLIPIYWSTPSPN